MTRQDLVDWMADHGEGDAAAPAAVAVPADADDDAALEARVREWEDAAALLDYREPVF